MRQRCKCVFKTRTRRKCTTRLLMAAGTCLVGPQRAPLCASLIRTLHVWFALMCNMTLLSVPGLSIYIINVSTSRCHLNLEHDNPLVRIKTASVPEISAVHHNGVFLELDVIDWGRYCPWFNRITCPIQCSCHSALGSVRAQSDAVAILHLAQYVPNLMQLPFCT